MYLKVHTAKKPIKTNHPIVFITGDGRTLPDDIKRFLEYDIEHDVFCIGRSYKLYPGKMDHWGDVDGTVSIWVAENLPEEKIKPETLRHTLGYIRGFDVDWDSKEEKWNPNEVMWFGSTALFAVHACLAMGYEKIVVAGCPLDDRGHWYFPAEITGPRWVGETYVAWLDFARTEQAQNVRAMSGYTAQIIGELTKEWLNGTTETKERKATEIS